MLPNVSALINTTFGGASNASINPSDYQGKFLCAGTFNDGSICQPWTSTNVTTLSTAGFTIAKTSTHLNMTRDSGGTGYYVFGRGSNKVGAGWACDVIMEKLGTNGMNFDIGAKAVPDSFATTDEAVFQATSGVNSENYMVGTQNFVVTNTNWFPVTTSNFTIIFNSTSVLTVCANNSNSCYVLTGRSYSLGLNFTSYVNAFAANTNKMAFSRAICYNATTGAPQFSHVVPQTIAGDNMSINATDIFDGAGITTFGVEIFGQGNNFYQNTSNGTILLTNVTQNFNYNITFSSNGTSTGFQSKTYLNVNITGQFFQGNLTPFAPIGPNASINGNNFFNSINSSIISIGRSYSVLLNLSFFDDIRLFGFEFNITRPDGTVLINFTNTSLRGTVDNFSRRVNVNGSQGMYTVGLTVWDSHTAKEIPDYKVDKGLDSIQFDDKITVSAEGAIWTEVNKVKDSYNFQFNYLPYISPNTKVFYVESVDGLEYIQDSKYKGHFIDWKNKKWIDFEGEEGQPIIEKINDKKYRITLEKEGSKVKFKSIGGLNSQTYYYTYYLSNISLSFYQPNPYDSYFNNSYQVSLLVNGNGRNRTQFNLYNSTFGLVQSVNITNSGTGSFLYNASFNSLIDNTYYINATNYDLDVGIFNATTTLYNTQLNNCTPVGIPSINYTLRDENNNSLIAGDFDIELDYTDVGYSNTKSYDDSRNPTSNFSVCIWPTFESVTGDYTILYSGTGYPQRAYSASGTTFSNITQNINLYLLSDSLGIYGRFRIVDQFGTVLTGAIGTMLLSGTSTIVEQEESDGAGLMTFFLDPDQEYDFTFSLSGYQTTTTTLRVTTTEIYTITLNSPQAAETQPLASGIVYKFIPENSILQNDTVYDFSFNLSSSYWNLTSCTFTLSNASIELNSSAIISQNSSGCIGTLRLNTDGQTNLIARGSIYINGTNITYLYQYPVRYTFVGAGSLKNFIDDVNSFSEEGFNDFGRFILSILVIFLLVAFAYTQTDFLPDIDQALIVLWAGTFFFSYIGWMAIPYASIPDVGGAGWLSQYILFILVSMGVGAYLVNKNVG